MSPCLCLCECVCIYLYLPLTSASGVTSSLPLTSLPSSYKALVTTVDPPRYSRISSLPQDPELNHICKIPFVTRSNLLFLPQLVILFKANKITWLLGVQSSNNTKLVLIKSQYSPMTHRGQQDELCPLSFRHQHPLSLVSPVLHSAAVHAVIEAHSTTSWP